MPQLLNVAYVASVEGLDDDELKQHDTALYADPTVKTAGVEQSRNVDMVMRLMGGGL